MKEPRRTGLAERNILRMATLPEPDRVDIYVDFMRTNLTPITALKSEIKATADAMDDWIDANMASLVASIPVGVRTKTTSLQKAQIFAALLRRRFLTGVL